LLLAGVVVIGVNGWRHHDRLVIVGDSMSVLAASDLRSTGQAAGYDVAVDAQSGVPLAARLDTLRQTVSSGAQRIVIELGTNDVLMGTPAATLDALIDQAVTEVQSVRCVVFVNVGLLAGPVALANHFNDHLHDDVALHPNEHEYDWSSEYHQHPDWTADAVHLQPQYWPFYAHGIVDTVRRSCR
jgi:hypothetical protein